MRTLSPVSSATSRRAVSSVVSPLFGRALGEGPGPAVALAAPAADDEPWLSVLVADDDAAGGGGGRGPQARHGAEAALGRRVAPAAPGAGPVHRRRADAGGHRGIERPAAGWTDRQPPRRLDQRRRHPGGAARSRASAVGAERAGRAQAESPLAARGPRAHEMRRRPGRVLRGDAVLHQAVWYRFSRALQGRARIDVRRAPVPARPGPRRAPPRARASGPVQRQHVRGVRARARPGARRASRRRRGRSARSAPPRIPRARALPSVCSMSGAVDRQRARLVEARPPGPARRSRRAAPRSRRRPAPPPRDRPPWSPAPAGPAWAPMASAMSASSAASWSSPSIATVAPWSAATARSVSAKATSGWNAPICVPAACAGARTSASSAPLVWTMAWPLYIRRPAASGAMASSGTATMMSSTSSRRACGSAKARDAVDEAQEPLASAGVAAGDRVDRPAGPRAARRRGRSRPRRPRRSR